jgi:hypothetical protein
MLVKIQNELKAPKGKYNSFGKYKYRTAEQILEAVKPILLKHNATLTITDEIIFIGNKFFLKSVASIGENSVAGFAEMSEHKGMSSEQSTGTASSYARKYALNGLFLIDESEADADSIEPKKQTLTSERFAKAIEALDAGKTTIEKIKEYELTEEQKLFLNSKI